MYRIGIDIGGMSAKFGLVEKDRVLEERVLETGADISYGKFLDDASDVVAALCENRKVEAVGISSCGLINSGQGKIVYSNNIGWEDKRIAADLLERTALPVRVANDAKCAALAEAVYGAGRAYQRVCMITLGTGVGGGFVCGGRLPAGLYADAWSSGKELSELKASLETIRATANGLITKIDGHLAQLQQEREARQEQAPSIWNGLDGLINDKPFMPGATPEQQANALIDFAERDGQRLGNEERRLIVDYANVIRDYHKVADLINELCEDGYELQHGAMDIAVKMRVEREIADAPPLLLDPDAEPLVTVIWSESADLRDGEQMPLSQADAVFKALDDAMKNEPGYDKTKFRIDFTMRGRRHGRRTRPNGT